MGRFAEIPRTAVFAWAPEVAKLQLATGTKAGTVDADFSSDTKLEIWSLNDKINGSTELQAQATIKADARFSDLTWTTPLNHEASDRLTGALENGAIDIWNVNSIYSDSSNARIERISRHSGVVRAIQYNPFRPELLASAGVNGELYITDISNTESSFRLGGNAGRSDNFDCLDWNKKVSYILATGSSGGFVTVWDVRSKKENLILNNASRRPVSAVKWDPEKSTRLVTAVPLDTDPIILVWDLRNTQAPEKTLTGHEGGVLSLDWCQEDSALLLSAGKDNRTLCWNTQTGDLLGELPVVTNWTFQTCWNPKNPNFFASASFDGKITVSSLQQTLRDTVTASSETAENDDDFFAKSQDRPMGASMNLKYPPKWLKRPVGAIFGFGSKLVQFSKLGEQPTTLKISKYVSDESFSNTAMAFEKSLREGTLSELCSSHSKDVDGSEMPNDWMMMQALLAPNPRGAIIEYLGFAKDSKPEEAPRKDAEARLAVPDRKGRLSVFFDKDFGDESFEFDVTPGKGVKNNKPFSLLSEEVSIADREITKALTLGQFDTALERCLMEDRFADAFSIAVCGGEGSIEKVQKAYFANLNTKPSYVRLLASVAGKNLWDLAYNADLANWRDVLAIFCTYANPDEFADLCETLGERCEDSQSGSNAGENFRRPAAACYIASANLERVSSLWKQEMQESEEQQLREERSNDAHSIHSRKLQEMIEKVVVFCRATNFQADGSSKIQPNESSDLSGSLLEYAELLELYGYGELASTYLSLLPSNFNQAEAIRTRLGKSQRLTRETRNLSGQQAVQQAIRQYQAPPILDHTSFAPSSTAGFQNSSQSGPYYSQLRGPINDASAVSIPAPAALGSYAPPSETTPSQGYTTFASSLPGQTPSSTTSKPVNMPNWNDTPEDFFKPPQARKTTPSVPSTTSVNGYAPTTFVSAPNANQLPPPPPRTSSALGPPPRAGSTAPPTSGVSTKSNFPAVDRPPSSTSALYAPTIPDQPSGNAPTTMNAQVQRGPSPYNNAPVSSGQPGGSRYAPTAAAQPLSSSGPRVAQSGAQFGLPSQISTPQNSTLPGNPPRAAPPPFQKPPVPGPPRAIAASQRQTTDSIAKQTYPPGNRDHLSAKGTRIYETLSAEMSRVKSKAPVSYKDHVVDTEKRLNILYDCLNNNELLQPDTVDMILGLSEALHTKNYASALEIQSNIAQTKTAECGNWMVGVKRLIQMSKSTP